MCLIDKLIRGHLNKKYDKNGKIAKLGKINNKVLDQLQKNLEQIEKLLLWKSLHNFRAL